MSWQAYVDNNLVGTGFVSQAGIYGINGGGVWASSAGFTVSIFYFLFVIAFFFSSLVKDGETLIFLFYLTGQAYRNPRDPRWFHQR